MMQKQPTCFHSTKSQFKDYFHLKAAILDSSSSVKASYFSFWKKLDFLILSHEKSGQNYSFKKGRKNP